MALSIKFKSYVFILICFQIFKAVTSKTRNVCVTPTCVTAAADILRSINKKINPCDNFYEFVCGQWIEKHQIPEDSSSIDMFRLAEKSIKGELEAHLASYNGSNKYMLELITFYDSCINSTAVEERGSEPLKKLLSNLGGWPVVAGKQWNASGFNWVRTIIAMNYHGVAVDKLVLLSVDADNENNSHNRIFVDQPNMILGDRSYYLDEFSNDIYLSYYQLMVKCAVYLGSDEQTAKKEMLEALRFETLLATMSTAQEGRRNVSRVYNLRTIGEIERTYPNLQIKKLWSALINDGEEVNDQQKVVVSELEYIKQFHSMIMTANPRTVANFLMWTVVYQSLDLLSNDWQQINTGFQKVYNGQQKIPQRDEFCMNNAMNMFPIALSALYVQQNRMESKATQLHAAKIIHNLIVKTKQTIRSLSWMKRTTKLRALRKINNMLTVVGYPNELFDSNVINHYYSNLNLHESDFFQNYFVTRKFNDDKEFKKIYLKNARKDWTLYGNVVSANAANQLSYNAVNILMGLLREPFFQTGRPSYINIAGIGAVIGHEITHAFDDVGRQFNEFGNAEDWWDAETDRSYRVKQQCVIDRYNNYTVEAIGKNLNGVNTQGENIADIGGFHIAYETFKTMEKQHGVESMLPGLSEYTQDQLFWIHLASIWCSRGTLEDLVQQIMTDPHSPLVFRVNGAFSNLIQFSRSFNCPLGSKMNPVNKCSIW